MSDQDEQAPTGAQTPPGGADLEAAVAGVAARANATSAAVERAGRRLDEVEQVVADLAEHLADTPAGGPWCWRYLDPYETAALLTEVRDWVDWMVVRYHVGTIIRPCWHLHPAAVEELTGLYVSWRATYQEKPRAYSDDLTAFHDRWFWPCLHRLEREKVFTGCTPLKHAEEEDHTRVTDPDQFQEHLNQVTTGAVPGRDAETVHAAIDRGEATPLNPNDPTTPVKWDGMWWAILANSPDGLWVPRPERVGAALDELAARQARPRPVKHPGRTGDRS